MKRIEGEIVVGAPYSLERYYHAHVMCPTCWLDHPSGFGGRLVRTDSKVMKQCYVCESMAKCYQVVFHGSNTNQF